MEQITNTSYIFTKEPVSFHFRRLEDAVLGIITSYRFINMQPHGHGVELEFEGGSLTLTQEVRRFRFRWQGEGIEVHIPIESRWFGLGELVNQPWDLGKVILQLSEVLTSDSGATGYSNLMSPVFLSDSGAALIVHSPFKLGINQPPGDHSKPAEYVFGEEIPFDQRPAFDTRGIGGGHITLVGDNLSFDLFIMDDLLSAHRRLIQELGHPNHTPPLELFGAPVWTTWAQYKDAIDEETVLDFAKQIISHGFPYQVLEIDDKWQTTYGDFEFNPAKFPTPHAMIERLHQEGFKVTCWVHPFFHPGFDQSGRGVEPAGVYDFEALVPEHPRYGDRSVFVLIQSQHSDNDSNFTHRQNPFK